MRRDGLMRRRRGLALGALALIAAGTSALAPPPPLVGGPCAYETYPGSIRITDIEKRTDATLQDQSTAAVQFQVHYAFRPDRPAASPLAKDLIARSWTLMLTSNARDVFPGPKYLKKYGLEVGKRYKADLSVITKGTCTPWRFDYKGLDPADIVDGAATS